MTTSDGQGRDIVVAELAEVTFTEPSDAGHTRCGLSRGKTLTGRTHIRDTGGRHIDGAAAAGQATCVAGTTDCTALARSGFPCLTCHILVVAVVFADIIQSNRQGVMELGPLIIITIGLTLGLGFVLSRSLRTVIAANWEKNRCEPSVVIGGAAFKPADDPRTPGQFAEDNWRYCQKEYVQKAVREAAELPRQLANAEAAVVNGMQDIAGDVGDVFFDLWKFCYEAYSAFMDRMKGVAKLFHNFMIQLHNIVNRLQASVISIVFALISLITAFVDSMKVIIMVALIIVGIILGMMVLLFLFAPEIAAIALAIVAVVTTTAVLVTKSFEPFSAAVDGACFAPDTQVILRDGTAVHITDLQLGTPLRDGGHVTAIHTFRTREPVWRLWGVEVSGDHLVQHPDEPKRLIPVRDHPDAVRQEPRIWDFIRGGRTLHCLTTTSRRIPVKTPVNGALMFADWEEIGDADTETQMAWNREVWTILNPAQPWRRPTADILRYDAGLSPECHVLTPSWLSNMKTLVASEIEVGDTVLDASGRPTEVVGVVRMEGDQSMDAICVAGGGCDELVSAASWVTLPESNLWVQPGAAPSREFTPTDRHVKEWFHIYTAAGTLQLENGWGVRDASEVGLENLRPLVEGVVLGGGTATTI